jgi:dTDP-4-amino-4,6-dideoxygalactose transaminase
MNAGRPIPFRRLDRKGAARRPHWVSAVDQMLASGDWEPSRHPLARVERAIAQRCGAEHCVATASGSAALLLAMRAFGIGPGAEVVTVANTYTATVSSIRLAGAQPVLIDVDPATYTMAPSALASAITDRTRLIVPVHLYGRVADMPAILEIAGRFGVPVLEEACQAFGAVSGSVPAGGAADAAVLSFGRTKAIAGPGEGGAVVTSAPALAERLRLLANQGRRGHDHTAVGSNFRMDPLAAAMLVAELTDAGAVLDRRRAVAARYSEALAGHGIVRNPLVGAPDLHGLYVYVVEVDGRDEVRTALRRDGIETAVHYPRAIYDQTAHADLPSRHLGETRALAPRIVSLPCDEYLTDPEVERVIEAMRRALRQVER